MGWWGREGRGNAAREEEIERGGREEELGGLCTDCASTRLPNGEEARIDDVDSAGSGSERAVLMGGHFHRRVSG